MENKKVNTPKVFEEWEEVDCNECEMYWMNGCDGVDKKRNCTSFKANRSVVIPEQIKELQKDIKHLTWELLIVVIGMIIYILGHAMGW